MITWGIVSAAFAFIPSISAATGIPTTGVFYSLRLLLLRAGTEHDRAQELLRSRYRQLAAMQSWGNLSVGADEADYDGQG
jgi:hypothetical protein